MNTMSAAPIASGARGALPRTAHPTVKTSPRVPMNSVTYLRIVSPVEQPGLSVALDGEPLLAEPGVDRPDVPQPAATDSKAPTLVRLPPTLLPSAVPA